jgi:hypothetical protein
MSPKLTETKDYILADPQEADYWEILEPFSVLFDVPEYPDKNVIWIFRKGPLKITYDDLYKIREFLDKNYPENAKTNRKVAVVVETGLQAAMAKEYVKIIESLPVEFRVFSDLKSAENWVTKN